MEGLTTLAQGIEEKLEKLKEQYESQLDSIRSQIDQVRRPPGDDDSASSGGSGSKNLQQLYKEAKEELGGNLAGEQLDTLVTDMDRSHQEQMADIQRQHVDDVDNQVKEIQGTLEEIYHSQLELVKSELEQSNQASLLEQRDNLEKQHKEETNKLEQEIQKLREATHEETIRLTLDNVIGKEDSAAFISKLNEKLAEEHREIIRKIEADLAREGRRTGANSDAATTEEVASLQAKAGDVQKSLEDQCDETAALRARMLGDYERLLTVRAEVMSTQTAEVETLQKEMATIQQQYEKQMAEFEAKVQLQTESSLRSGLESSHTKELEKMKQYYEEKVTTMEQSYTSDINKLKQEHEELLARLQEGSTSPPHSPRSPQDPTAASLENQRRYVRKTMTFTAISDEEQTPPSSPSGNDMLEGRIMALETRLKDREKLVDELKKRLEAETTSAEDLHGKLLDSNKTLYEYEESLKQKIDEIDSLRDQLKGKDSTIKDLESEKAALEEGGEKGVGESKVIAELRERVSQLEIEISASKETNKKIQGELSQLDAQHGEAIMQLKVEMENMTKMRLEEAEAGFKIQLEEELKQQAEEMENKFRDEISKQSQELEKYEKTEKKLRNTLEKVNVEHEKQLTELTEKMNTKKQEKFVDDSAESTIVVSEIQETESSSPSFSTTETVDRNSLEAAIRENVKAEILHEYEESIDKLKSEYELRISELNSKLQSFEERGAEKAEVCESEKESDRTFEESLRSELALEYKEKLQNVTSQYEDKLKHLQGIVDGRKEGEDTRKEVQSQITRSKSVDSEAVMKEKDVSKIPKEYEGFVSTIRRDYEDKIQTLQSEFAQYRSTMESVPSTHLPPKSTLVSQMEHAHGDTVVTQDTKQATPDAGSEFPARPSDDSPEKQDMYDDIAAEFETSFKYLRTTLEKEIETLKAKIATLESEKDVVENKVREELTATYEAEIEALKDDYEEKITKLEADVKKAKNDKSAAEQKVKADMFVWHEETVNQLKRKHEETISQLSRENEEKMDLTREELQEEFDVERAKIEYKHRQEIVDLEDRYETLVEGVRTGGAPEVALMVQEKFDLELEMAKTLIQQECDETIESETSRLNEEFEAQLKETLSNRDEELAEQKAKHEKEIADLRVTLLQQYESQLIELQSQHQASIQKAQLDLDAVVEKTKSENLKSEVPSPKSQKSYESKTSEESEIEEEIEAVTSTSSVEASDRSDKDDDDGKGAGGSAARDGQTGETTEQRDQDTDKPDGTDTAGEKTDTAGSATDRDESEIVLQLRQELAHKIVESETSLAQLKVIQEEEMSQLEEIINEKEADYQRRYNALEQQHEQEVLQYQTALAELKQGLPDTDATEAMELAHQQELQDLEDRLVQKHKNDVDNLERQHQSKLNEIEEKHSLEVNKLQAELLEAQRALEQYPDAITPVQEVPTFTAAVGSSLGSSKGECDFMAPSRDNASSEVEEPMIEAEMTSRSESLQGEATMETQVFETRTSSEEKTTLDASLQGTLEEFGVQSLDTSMDRSRGTLRGVDTTQDSELIHFSEEDSDKSETEADTTQKSDRSTPPGLMQTLGYGAILPGGPTVKSLDDTTDSSIRASDREEGTGRIKELESEVHDLREKLESELSKQEVQMDRLDREKQEEGNLVAMLRADIERLNHDRDALQSTNEHLLGLLSDAVKTYMNNEELINKKLKVMMDKSLSERSGDKGRPGSAERKTSPASRRSPATSPGRLSPARADDSDNVQETSMYSNVTDEGLDLSQRITDSIFQGPDIATEEEELMIDSGNRLCNSVTHLLDMIEETTNQLLETRQTQAALAETLEGRERDLEQLTERSADLEERLREEAERKDYLALELNKAQGLVEGYSSENETLEQKIQDLEEQKETLILELETTKNKLLDMNSVQNENENLRREMASQRDLMAGNVGEEAQASRACESTVVPPSGEPALMLEVTRLNSENREKDVQIRAAHERYESRIRDLEHSGEDMEGHYSRLLDEKKQEVIDLQLQVEALEKQLKAKKQFLEEQTGEREQEHEDYQKEMEKWKKMVQDLEKQNGSGSRLQKEVDDLTDQLQSRVDLHSQALLELERAQQLVREKDLSMKELGTVIQQLEAELQEKATQSQHDQQKNKKLEELLQGQLSEEESSEADKCEPLEAQTTASLEFDVSEAERQERLAAQLTVEEEMRQAAEKTKEELVQEKHALQTQLNASLVQLSDVRNQLDKMRHRQMLLEGKDNSERLSAERERMEVKETEISDMKLQIELLTEEIHKRDQQMEQLRSASHHASVEQPEEYEMDRELQLQMNALKRENKLLRERVQLSHSTSSVTDISGLSQNLLHEKNAEIDFLSEQILRLQTEFNELKAEKGVESMYEEIEGLREELKQRERELEAGQSVRVSATFTDHSLTPDASLMNVGASFADKTSIQQEMEESVASRLDRVVSLESEVTAVKAVLQNKEEQIATLQEELKELTEKLEQAQANIGGGDDVGMLQDVIQEKEELITQMTVQVDSLQTEVDNLSDFQNKLQEDFDTVQTMLEEKDREIESLHKELTDRSLESREDHTLVIKHEVEISRLKKDLREKDNVIEEKLEELAELTDKLEVFEAEKPEETIRKQQEEIVTLKNTVEQLLGRPPSPPKTEEDEEAVVEKQKLEIEALKEELESLKLGRPPSPPGGENSDVVQRLRGEIDRLKQHIMDSNLPEDDKTVLIRDLRLQNDTLQKQVEAALKIRPPSPPSDDDDKLEIIHDQKKEIERLRSEIEAVKSDQKSEDEKSELLRKQEKEIGKLKKQVEDALQLAQPPPLPEDEPDATPVSTLEESLREKEKLLDEKEEKLKQAEEHLMTLQEELKSAKEVKSYEDEIELKEKEDEIEELTAELERYRSGTDSTLAQSVDMSVGESRKHDSKQLERSMSFYKEQFEEKCSENRQLQVSVDLLKQKLDNAMVEQIDDPQTRSEIELFKEELKSQSEEEVKELKERRDSLEKEVKELKLELSKFDQDPDVRLMSLEKELQHAKEEAANERMDTVQAINDLEKLRERKEKERKESVKSIQELESQLDEKTNEEKVLTKKVKELTEELATLKQSKSLELKKSNSQEAFELGTDIGTLQQQVLQYKQQADKTNDILAEKQKYQSQVVKLEIQYENLQKQLTKDVGALEEQLKNYQTHPEQDVWAQLQATQERLEKTSDQLNETSIRLNEADTHLRSLSEDLRHREDDMKELQQDLWKTSSQLSVTSGKLAETEEKLRLTVSQVTEREEQIHQLQGELLNSQTETEEAQQLSSGRPEEVERLKKQLKSAQTELEEVKRSLKEAVEMSEQQLQMVETKDQEYVKLKLDIQQTIANKDKAIREHKQKLKESEQEAHKAKQEAARTKQDATKVKQESDQKEEQISTLTTEVSRLREQVSQSANDSTNVAALRAQLQNQEEMIAELRKNDEYRKAETGALQDNLAEFRKNEESLKDDKEALQNRVDNLQRELEQSRSLAREVEERSRSSSRDQSTHDQGIQVGDGLAQPEGEYVQQQERYLEGQPKGQRSDRGQGDQANLTMSFAPESDNYGHQTPLGQHHDIDCTPEGQRLSQQRRGDPDSAVHDSGYARSEHFVDDFDVHSTHSQQTGSQQRSPSRHSSSSSPRSEGQGSPHSSRGHRGSPGSAGSRSSHGQPEVDTRSSPRSGSSASVPRYDMSTSPPVREPRPSQDTRSSPLSEARQPAYDGQSRSPSRSDGHRSPPDDWRSTGERSPPHSDRRSPPHHDIKSPRDERRSPHDRRDHDDRSPPQDDTRSPSRSDSTRSPSQQKRVDPREDGRSPPHYDTRSPSRSDGHRSPPHQGQGAPGEVTRSPPRIESRSSPQSERRQDQGERYIGENGQLYDRDDNIRPRYTHAVEDQRSESHPRSEPLRQSTENLQRSEERSRSTETGHDPDNRMDDSEGHVPSEAERYIQQLRRELLITKTALMQIQKGGDLDREVADEDYVQEAMTQAQDALQQEVRPEEARYREAGPRDRSSSRYETLPDEDHINRLQRDLDRAEEELELYRTSSSLSARDFVQKIMSLKEELSSEHQRHLAELQTRTQRDGDAQLEALRLRYEDEVAAVKQLHAKELQGRLEELQLRLERRHKAEMNKEKVRHTEETTLLRSRAGLDLDDGCRLGERQGGVGQDRSGTAMVNGHSGSEPMSAKLQDILRRLHSEGVQVLSISELLMLNRSRSQTEDPRGGDVDVETLTTGWENERQSMISTIQSLKDLLAQTHKLQGLDKSAEGSDWRAELLRAIGYVFSKERESQLAELRSHALSHPSSSIDEIQRLEQQIRNMESHHHSALDQIFGADRQSLLAEIRDLRAHAAITRMHNQEERERLNEQLSHSDEQSLKKERQLKRQDDDDDEDSSSEYGDLPEAPEPLDFISAGVQLLEFKIQQEKVLQEDLRTSLDAERHRSGDLTGQLTREKDGSLELQSSVTGLQVQVARLREALEREQSRYVSVTNALEEEKTKSLNLSDLLDAESTKLWQAQQEIDQLKGRQNTVDPHRIQEVEEELAAERDLRFQLQGTQEIQQVTIDNLKQEVEMGKRHLQEVEKSLENERHLSNRLQQTLEAEKSSSVQITDRERSYILDLQDKLKTEQAKVNELNSYLQSEQAKVSELNGCLQSEQATREDATHSVQSERNMLREHLSKERSLNHEMKQDLEKLQFDRLEAVNKLQKEKETVQRLRVETDKLSDELRRLRSQEMQRDHEREVEKMADRKSTRDTDRQKEEYRMKLHEHQLESQRLSQKAASLEEQLAASRENELKAIRELEQQKLRNLEAEQQQPELVSAQTSPRKEDQSGSGGEEQRERQRVYRCQLDSMCQSLHYLLLRYREQINKVSHKTRHLTEVDDLETVQRSLYDLRQELKQLQELEGDFMTHPSSSVNERILRQNEELTNFVARISEEKTELRNTLTQLEEEIWKYRKLDSQYQEIQRGLEGSDQVLAKERARWSAEKLSLQMALNSAEHEINLLQSDLRVEREQRVAAGLTETRDADKMKIQRLYGKYLRAESFRKALIYQKKYLLLLLGGFRDTEETTLSLLCRMGAVDTHSHHHQKRRPMATFRGAVRVVIAICRMKYLVKKWKRATRVGSEVVGGTFDENEGYVQQNNAYSPPSPPRYTPSARVVTAPVRSTTPTLRASPRRQASPQRSSDSMVYLGRRDYSDTDGYSTSSYQSPRATTLTNVPFTPPTKDYGSSPASYTSSTPGARRKLLTSGRMSSAQPSSNSVHFSPDLYRNGVSQSGDVNDYAHRLENLQNRLGKLQNDRQHMRKGPWR